MICIIIAGWLVLLWGAEETLGEKAAVGFPLTDVGSGADCKLGQKVGANFITHNKGASFPAPITRGFFSSLGACSCGIRVLDKTCDKNGQDCTALPRLHPGVLLAIETLGRA